MVAGPNVYICDGCLEQAARQLAPRKPAPDAVRCRFCGQFRAKEEVTAVGNVLQSGRKIAYVEAKLVDPSGKLLAHGTGSLLIMPKDKPQSSKGNPT